MKNTLEIKTFVSNHIPEWGYLSKVEESYLPIDHPLAEMAAVKLLEYEEDYLPGYLEIKINGEVLFERKDIKLGPPLELAPVDTETDDVVSAWSSFLRILHKNAKDTSYNIELIGIMDNLTISKEKKGYQFVLTDDYENILSESDVFLKEDLLVAIAVGVKQFGEFTTKNTLKFGKEIGIEILLSDIKDLLKD
ncbi:hypothetical protein [Alkalihalobacterium bogoriense]|uniref:hypothetical protein n=1 Tax=Alkalihalobacterium bogoriense TaxID=246272 RepID=UPI00047A1964|nr:hypothetical protein [Alkalihalobacterium bogoriense]